MALFSPSGSQPVRMALTIDKGVAGFRSERAGLMSSAKGV